MIKKAYISILLIILLICLTGCMSIFPKEDEMLLLPVPSTAPVEYKTINPTKGDIVNSITILCNVANRYENLQDQFFSVDGYLEELFVENEQYVEKGQLIAVLSDREDREQVENTYLNALNEFIRVQDLYVKNAATEYQFRRAEIAYNHAKEKYDDLYTYMTNKELRASQSGFIVNIRSFTNDIAKGTPIGKTIRFCSIATGQYKSISGTASAANASKLKPGASVIIVSKEIEYDGYVLTSEGTNLSFGLDDMDAVTAGEVVQIKVIIDEVYDVLKLPKYAVTIREQKTAAVRVLKDNTPTNMEINIGLASSSEVEILPGQGIDEDTMIITGTN